MNPPDDAGQDRESQPDANKPNSASNSSPESRVFQFLNILIDEGEVFEVRIMDCADKPGSKFRSTVVGYYQHSKIAKAAADVAKVDASGRAPVIYVTLNPVLPDLLARAANRLKDKAKATAKDEHIQRRRWLLIDCDPTRPTDLSSTDEELERSRLTAEQSRTWLVARGWPEPLIVMSGNGYHLLFRIDLPTQDAGLVKRVLTALAHRFDDASVGVDLSVDNPARITKLVGTIAAGKGDDFPGVEGIAARPHRRAVLVSAPEPVLVVTQKQLEELAAEAPSPAVPKSTPARGATVDGRSPLTTSTRFERFDHTPDGVRGYLTNHGIVVTGEKREGNATLLFLDRCPVVADCVSENKSDIAVIVGDDGKISYKNLHNRGVGLVWFDVREALEPGYKDHVASTKGRSKRDDHTSTWSLPASEVQLKALSLGDGGRLYVSVTDATGNEIVRDGVDQNSARSRKSLIKYIEETVPLSDEQRKEVDKAIRQLSPPPLSAGAEVTPTDALSERDEKAAKALAATPPSVIAEAEAMLAAPNLIDTIIADIETMGVVGERVLGLTIYLIGTSRLLESPLSGKVQGTSSSGKSFILERVGKLFPEESVLIATDLTANSLYYMTFGALIHTLVLGGERSKVEDEERAESKRALREMISGGALRKVLPIKQPDGSFISQSVFQPGPIAHLESTTNTQIFDEDANRTLLLSTDESPDQTARIIMAAAAAAEQPPSSVNAIEMRHQAAQRLLKRVKVRVPFARALAKFIEATRPQARRAFNQGIGVIRAIALLRQRQRKAGPIQHGDVIDAVLDDYAVARRVLMGPFGQSLGKSLPDAIARFGQRLSSGFGEAVFSSTQAERDDPVLGSRGKVNEYLRALAHAGVLEVVDDSKGSKPKTYRFISDVPESGVTWLPTVEQLERGVS